MKTPLLVVHILAGCIGIIAASTALLVGKGTRLHRSSGMSFVFAMLVLGTTASVIATLPGVDQSVFSGLIAVYLVMTAMTAVKPLPDRYTWIQVPAMLFALMCGMLSAWSGVQALSSGGWFHGAPAPMHFLFTAVLTLAAWGDFQIIRNGPRTGTPRLVRHIWRMCYSMFIATGSFFIGQSDEFPKALRHPLLIFPLGIAPLFFMFYWLWRVRIRRSLRGLIIASSPRSPGRVSAFAGD